MNPILQAIQRIISPQNKIISPLPASDSPGGYNNEATNPALAQYYAQQQQANQITPQQAQANTFQPKTVQYPSWMANAPGGPNIASVMGVNTQQTQPSSPFNIQALGQAISSLSKGKAQPIQAEQYPQDATFYEKQAAKIFNKYGVPPAIGLGIWAMEGRGKTINPNNPYNIGAYDTNPQNANAYKFSSPLEGTDEAAQFLAGKSPYMDATKKKIFQAALAAYKKSGDQNAYLAAIAPTYSSNPTYAQTIMQTPEYQRWSYNK